MANSRKQPRKDKANKKSAQGRRSPTNTALLKKAPTKRNESFTFMNVIRNIFYGIIIGSSMLIPGVSGGTMAIILGIYDELIGAVSSIFKRFRYSFLFILQVAIGGVAGILLFSKLILDMIEAYELPMTYLFMGAMLGSIPALYRKGCSGRFSLLNILWAVIGAVLVYMLDLMPKGRFTVVPSDLKGFAMLVVCGIIIAVALVLPGISTSHILLLLGMYETVWGAVSNLNFVYLLPIFLGALVGIMLSAKILDKAMRRFPRQTYLLIIGFVLASIIDIFPGWPSGFCITACIGGLILGAGVVYLLQYV